MTNKEKRDRINQLNEEIERLRKEREEYRKELSDEKALEIHKEREKYIGKCFSVSKIYSNRPIKAFKVINILQVPHDNYAECIVLHDDSGAPDAK